MDRKDILADFLIERPEGYYCSYGDFFIDAHYPVKNNVVSHAHGDHATPGHQYIYCTPTTSFFMKQRYHSRLKTSEFHLKGFDEMFTIGGVQITFIPAGHMLGSAQILMEYKGVKYLYTGDYKLQSDPTCEPCQVVSADVLITESTFADPSIQHPNPVDEIKKLNDQPYNILLGVYALGKAQRITQLINQYCPEKRVLVHHNILPFQRIYDEFGFVALDYEDYNRKEMKIGATNKIYLVPPMTFNNYFRAKNVVRAFASGWERLQKHNDLSVYISDHVDWQDILTYVEAVSPSQIWTLHGDGSYLKSHFESELTVRNVLS